MGLMIHEDELLYVCEMMHHYAKMPIFSIDLIGGTLTSLVSNTIENPLQDKWLEDMLQHCTKKDFDFPITVITLNNVEYYLCIRARESMINDHILFLGPCVFDKITKNVIYDYMIKNKVPRQLEEKLRSYLLSLPLYNKWTLSRFGQMFYYLLMRERVGLTDIQYLTPFSSDTESELQQQVANQKIEGFLHHENKYENIIRQLIKEGRLDALEKLMASVPELQGSGTVARNNPVRNEKNLAIVCVTLASRAAMDGGLNSEIAYTLSDMFIQQIESDTNFNTFVETIKKVFKEYAKQVMLAKEQRYSKVVIKVEQFIYNNLYQKLSVQEIANNVGLSADYLSKQFKKDTGITIVDYILQEKIKEAKNLINYTNLSISEISNYLQFYDQSHFIRVFKRICGITPKQYKLQNLNLDIG
ncbi:AraC family transcriptional regulator [Paenibacillus lutimineralis]|uniref:AraC family transcriptional regulator n=1 Tax=Paenibacillus lutimineralis TaxID=2707005 RepID=A0A3S9V151_9BACL|nr:AraC family transcriptional regulator [Paenibacillus lutimineralis]AZS16302.1 AraC family transcriptional regulator [Paenibacillus lutimineralis]